jgi:hypothetical protein
VFSQVEAKRCKFAGGREASESKVTALSLSPQPSSWQDNSSTTNTSPQTGPNAYQPSHSLQRSIAYLSSRRLVQSQQPLTRPRWWSRASYAASATRPSPRKIHPTVPVQSGARSPRVVTFGTPFVPLPPLARVDLA